MDCGAHDRNVLVVLGDLNDRGPDSLGAIDAVIEAVDNPAAQALYRRFGLAPVGVHRGYYADMGLSPDAIVMRADGIHQPDYANRLTNIAVELDCT